MIGQRVAYLAEGPFDWIAALGWGLPAFSICGTHFPLDRLPALESAVAIYGIFDPDGAGRQAAERFAPLIGEEGWTEDGRRDGQTGRARRYQSMIWAPVAAHTPWWRMI